MNWLLIIVGAILLIGAINGFAKGAVRILVSLVATVVTIIIVFYTVPYVSQMMYALTPADEIIEKKCVQIMTEAAGEMGEADLAEELPRNMQIAAIENSPLPDTFKELLLCNNNEEVYHFLGVTTFVEYIGKYLTKLIIDIISFLLTFVVVTIIIKFIIFALDIVAKLPVLGTLNRLSGAAIGISLSLIIVWFIFVIITLIYTTENGQILMKMITEDDLLLSLYEINPIMKLMTMFR